MIGRLVAGTTIAGTVLLGGAAARHARARRLARARNGHHPSVLTDDGVRLHVDVAGPPDAPAVVVFAHGYGAASAIFDPQWAALRNRARLVRYDQRGHGASGWAGTRSATVDRLARDLEQVVETQAGDAPVVVVGHSMGGMAVLALAGRRPELFGSRIAGVALLSTRAAPLPGTGSPTTPRGRLRTGLTTTGAWLLWVVAPVIDALHPMRSRPGRWVLRRRLFAGHPPEGDVRAMSDMWDRTPTSVLTSYLTTLATYDERPAMEALRNVPVLVLAGTEDTTIPPSSAQRLARGIGDSARLVLVPDAGHMVNVTHADTVNSALDVLVDRTVSPLDARSSAWHAG